MNKYLIFAWGFATGAWRSYLFGECTLKPPVDWSPCQQKGEEHDWKYELMGATVACANCGVMVYEYALRVKEAEKNAGVGELGESS